MANQTGQECLNRLIKAKVLHAVNFAHEIQANLHERKPFADAFGEMFTLHPEGIMFADGTLVISIAAVTNVPSRVKFLLDVGIDLKHLATYGFSRHPGTDIWSESFDQTMVIKTITDTVLGLDRKLPRGVILEHLLDAAGVYPHVLTGDVAPLECATASF